jgi:predicted deacylase
MFNNIILIFIILLIIIYYTSIINNICYKEPEYFIYKGKEEGSTILIIGATHGNEPAGYFAIKEYMAKLNSQELFLKRGKIIFIPTVNYCGLQLNSRNHNTVGDINRLYNITNKNIINNLIAGFTNTTDFIIDFHEGYGYANNSYNSLGSTITSSETILADNVANKVVENINKNITIDFKKFKINKEKNILGSLRDYAVKLKLNYILIETTGQNNIQPLEVRVNQCINVINTVITYFNLF